MCMFGSTPAPAAPAPLTPPPRPPAETDPAVTQAGIKNKQKAALAQGMNNTVLTRLLQGRDNSAETEQEIRCPAHRAVVVCISLERVV